MSDADEKTFDPTPRRRQLAREAGQFPVSQDLCGAALVLGGLAGLAFGGTALCEFLTGLLRAYLDGSAWRPLFEHGVSDSQIVTSQWHALMPLLARALLPVLVGAGLISLAVSLLQTNFSLLPARVAPDWSRINPLAGTARIFSGASFARLALGLLKLTTVGAVAVLSIWGDRQAVLELAGMPLAQAAPEAWRLCASVLLKIGGCWLALAVVDYGYQRWRHERSLRMTPQELREEMRQERGDPQIATRRRALRQQILTPGTQPAKVYAAGSSGATSVESASRVS